MDLFTLILLVIAGVVVFKLRSVLGERDEDEDVSKPKGHFVNLVETQAAATTATIEPKQLRKSLSDAAHHAAFHKEIERLQNADRDFTLTEFIEGAKFAIEEVNKAFYTGNLETLKQLTTPQLFADLEPSVANNAKANETYQIVKFDSVETREITFPNEFAEITLQVKYSYLKYKGSNATAEKTITQNWIFERRLASKDPNWQISEIATAE